MKALYVFTADPIHYGHIDIIKRAAGKYDSVIAGVGTNPTKTPLFDLEERLDMAQHVLADIPNVKVVPFKGLTADLAYESDAVIVKGYRTEADKSYEELLDKVNKSQIPESKTELMFAVPELAHVSSTVVKALQREHGDLRSYVPLYVKQKIEAKLSKQYILGITGEIGSGKSYISQKFEEIGAKKGIKVHNIDLDAIGHKITNELTEESYVKVRKQIADAFGPEVLLENGFVNRKVLGRLVFNNPEKMEKLNEIMKTPLAVGYRRALADKEGLILFNAALMAELGTTYKCNNNILVVKSDWESQSRRLQKRGLSILQIRDRIGRQYLAEQKEFAVKNAIARDGHGRLWTLDNSDGTRTGAIELMFDDIARELKICR